METALPLGYWLTLVDRLVEEQFAEVLEEHGVTRRQWHLLSVMDEEVVRHDDLDEASRAQLAELVESGWVRQDEGRYLPTERGALARDGLRDPIARIQERLTEGLSPAEYDAAAATLERMARNLGWEA